MRLIYSILFAALSITNAEAQNLKYFDIWKGAWGSVPDLFTEYKGKLYFQASDSIHGYELWGIDANDNVKIIADLNPGTANGVPRGTNSFFLGPYRRNMVVAGFRDSAIKLLCFLGCDGVHGVEVFTYDGINPPAMAQELIAGSKPSLAMSGEWLEMLNNKVYRAYSDSIWQYDGKTSQIKFIYHLPSGLAVRGVKSFKGKIYFPSDVNTLGQYDPATNAVQNISLPGSVDVIEPVDDKLYIGIAGTPGHLYEYDGMNTPVQVADYYNNQYSGVIGYYSALIGSCNHKVYFPIPNNSITFPQLGEYDPQTGNVKTIAGNNDTIGSFPNSITSLNGILYYAATDTLYYSGPAHYTGNYELWQYDGVHAPSMAADVYPGKFSSSPCYITAFNNAIYFGTSAGSTRELYKYTPANQGVKNLAFAGEVKLYPNPAPTSAILELNLPEAMNNLGVILRNTEGKEVVHVNKTNYAKGRSNIVLNLQNLATGVYFYSLIDEGGKMLYSGKLIIE